MGTPKGSTRDDWQYVNAHKEQFRRVHETHGDEFRLPDLEIHDARGWLERARGFGLVTISRDIGGPDESTRERYYTWTPRGEELLEEYCFSEIETICPCDCIREGFHHREDGRYECLNPDCEAGPWERADLNV